MKPRIEVACAIIREGSKILVAQRGPKMRMSGQWEFPGGKLEPNESAQDCLHRELREELDIVVEIQDELPSVLHEYDDFQVNLIPFQVKLIRGVPVLKEHAQISWQEIEKLDELDWTAADVPIVQFLQMNLD